MAAIVLYDHINIKFEPRFELLMMLADNKTAMSTNYAFSSAFFSDQYIMKNSCPLSRSECKRMCQAIVPTAYWHRNTRTGKCHCDFCSAELIPALFCADKMTYFLDKTACNDLFDLKKSTARGPYEC